MTRLIVEADLRSLISHSSDCVWRRDAGAYAECWASDGEWRILGEVVSGRSAIVARWLEFMQPFERVWQVSHNITFVHEDDIPSARSFLEETLVSDNGEVALLKGIYHDQFKFEGGSWRFGRRHIDIAYLGAADWSGKWFHMDDPGAFPSKTDPDRRATPSMIEAYGG